MLNSEVERSVGPTEAPAPARRILIAVPFYKNEDLVASLIGSLIVCAADIALIGGEVVLFDDSPDYPALKDALDAILPQAQSAFPCRVVRNPQNLGFVKTMNLAIAEAVDRKLDLLMLNSDTIVHPGALTEIARVAGLDPMIGFVCPRSDNATLATLPVIPRGETQESFDPTPYLTLGSLLPDFSYVPTAVGFCMLVRWNILADFGGFDEIYGAGYNEENDLVMRAARCGYRAALANRAFVQHEMERSFQSANTPKAILELTNRAILDKRYPEYSAFTSAYFTSPETVAEEIISALVPDRNGRLDLAFDFSSFAPRHTGTYQVGRSLVKSAMEHWTDKFNIHVLCSQEVYDFHDYAALGVRRSEPEGPEKFAVIFREGQPYDWDSIKRLILKGAVIGIHMLDTISIDCSQLTSQALFNIWQFALWQTDFFVAISRQSMNQIRLRFQIPDHVAGIESLLSLNIDDYRLDDQPADAKRYSRGVQTILVIGNHFPHKFLVPTANALARAFPDRRILALGQSKPSIAPPFNPYGLPELGGEVNLVGIDLGQHTDAEMAEFYVSSDVLVFPSHYEGFGIPVLNALAVQRPVFVRRLPVFEELWEGLGRTPNIHFYETTADLAEQLRTIPTWIETPPALGADSGADRTASEIRHALETAVERVNYRRVVERVRLIQMIDAAHSTAAASAAAAPAPSAVPPSDAAAHFLGDRVEWFARRLLRVHAIYVVGRIAFKVLRPVLRMVRRMIALRHRLRPRPEPAA